MAKDKEPKAPLPKGLVQSLPVAMKIMDHVRAINDLMPQLQAELHSARMHSTISLARSYVVTHRLVERLEEALKPLVHDEKGLFNIYKREIIPYDFDMEGVSSIPLDEGFRVGTAYTLRASIRPNKKDHAYQWLRENALPDLIASSVNSSSLSSAARELLEKNLDMPDELFNVAMMPTTSVTRVK